MFLCSQILAVKVMHDCAAAMLYSVQSEEKSIECFCTLITTAGKGMDEDEGKVCCFKSIESLVWPASLNKLFW